MTLLNPYNPAPELELIFVCVEIMGQILLFVMGCFHLHYKTMIFFFKDLKMLYSPGLCMG